MNLNEEDFQFLRVQPLWTACKKTPFLIRAGINVDKCVLFITNIRRSFTCKLNRDEIQRDKERFNAAISTPDFQGILNLLELALQFDPEAEYIFDEKQNSLQYKYNNIIKIYKMQWIFNCQEIQEKQHFELLIKDLINPLFMTINSLENRCTSLKTANYNLEQEYLQKLNEKEKQQYKIKEEDLNNFLVEQNEDEKLCQVQFNPSTNFFIQFYTLGKLNKQSQSIKKRQLTNEQQDKQVTKIPQILYDYEQQINNLKKEEKEEDPILQNKPKNTKKKLGFL